MLRCQAGDEAAFQELVTRYSPRLGYFLRKLIGDAHSADDVLQEVWFDVFRAVTKLTDPAAFAPWVYRIARDRAYRQLRGRGIALRSMEAADEVISATSDSGANGIFTEEDVAQVHAAMDRLAPEHREVLVLRFLEGMSYEEISGATGSQLGTVRSRLHYAKRALRRALERVTEP